MIDETQKLSESFPQSHMRKLLEVDTDHLRTLLPVLNGQKLRLLRYSLEGSGGYS